jgi:iron(III) transport system substrate-binding protein
VLVTGTGNEVENRILAERRSGKYLADVFGGSPSSAFQSLHKAGVLDPIKPLLTLPEVVDESQWFEGRHRYGDPESRYIFVYVGTAGAIRIAYNSNLVNPNDFTSYRDFLNPKWKGKILSRDPRTSRGIMQFFYFNPMLGPEFIKHLYQAMDVTLSRDLRQMMDWLAVGKFAICIGARDVKKAKNQGLPVDEFDKRSWKEGVVLSASGGSVSLLNRAPNPNGAKIFINWFLSRKGQVVYQELSDADNPPNSLRKDIPKDVVAPDNRIFEGMKYMDLTKAQEFDMTPISELLNEIMKGR